MCRPVACDEFLLFQPCLSQTKLELCGLISTQPQKCSTLVSSLPRKVDFCCFDFQKSHNKPEWLCHAQPVPEQASRWRSDLQMGSSKPSPGSWPESSQLEDEARAANGSKGARLGAERQLTGSTGAAGGDRHLGTAAGHAGEALGKKPAQSTRKRYPGSQSKPWGHADDEHRILPSLPAERTARQALVEQTTKC